MAFVDTVVSFLSSLTLLGGIIIALLFLDFFYMKSAKKHAPLADRVWSLMKNNALFYAFAVALVATAGSLFFSEVAGYQPCKLCWFQRIFMYPLVLILFIAMIKKTKEVVKYVIPMSLIGAFIASYHYYGQMIASSLSCSADAAVSCTAKPFFHYGYITIPMMALTAFVLIFILMLGAKRVKPLN